MSEIFLLLSLLISLLIYLSASPHFSIANNPYLTWFVDSISQLYSISCNVFAESVVDNKDDLPDDISDVSILCKHKAETKASALRNEASQILSDSRRRQHTC